MPILGSLGINLGTTGSEATASGINFFYAGQGGYINPLTTGSVGSIKAYVENYDNSGASGRLAFYVPSQEKNNDVGSPILTLGAVGANNEPRIGIGFAEGEQPTKQFDIKSLADSATGTELLIRSARSANKGADIGDAAGVINFAIDTGSSSEVDSAGSVGKIKGIVTQEKDTNIDGKLVFELFKGATTSSNDVIEFGYDISSNQPGNYNFLYTGSMEIKDFDGTASVLEMRDQSNDLYFSLKTGSLYAKSDSTFGGNINISSSTSTIVWETVPTRPSIGAIYKTFNNGTTLLFEAPGCFSATYTIISGSQSAKTGVLVGNIVGGTSPTDTTSSVSFSDTNATIIGPLDFQFSASSNNLTGSARKLQIYGITPNPNVTLSGIIQNV